MQVGRLLRGDGIRLCARTGTAKVAAIRAATQIAAIATHAVAHHRGGPGALQLAAAAAATFVDRDVEVGSGAGRAEAAVVASECIWKTRWALEEARGKSGDRRCCSSEVAAQPLALTPNPQPCMIKDVGLQSLDDAPSGTYVRALPKNRGPSSGTILLNLQIWSRTGASPHFAEDLEAHLERNRCCPRQPQCSRRFRPDFCLRSEWREARHNATQEHRFVPPCDDVGANDLHHLAAVAQGELAGGIEH
mmetsp:Transcript_120747/g.386536  ORF Transcript_120747/g.386536 Transcript_120747/m.386536 type:complete len:248 (+) Transcript_120747:3201-3944(+)